MNAKQIRIDELSFTAAIDFIRLMRVYTDLEKNPV